MILKEGNLTSAQVAPSRKSALVSAFCFVLYGGFARLSCPMKELYSGWGRVMPSRPRSNTVAWSLLVYRLIPFQFSPIVSICQLSWASGSVLEVVGCDRFT